MQLLLNRSEKTEYIQCLHNVIDLMCRDIALATDREHQETLVEYMDIVHARNNVFAKLSNIHHSEEELTLLSFQLLKTGRLSNATVKRFYSLKENK